MIFNYLKFKDQIINLVLTTLVQIKAFEMINFIPTKEI